MFKFPAFLDPSLRFILSADGDNPPESGAGGGSPPAGGEIPPAPDPAAGTPPAGAAAAPDTGAEPPAKPQWTPEALEKQVARQHRKIKELEPLAVRNTELEAENRRLRELAEAATRGAAPPASASESPPISAPAPAARPPVPPAPAQTPEAIKAQARFEVQVETLQQKIAADYEKDWPVVYENYQKVGGLDNGLMEQILATDDPAYVLIELGKNPAKLQDTLDMNGARRQAALIKIALGKTAPPAAGDKPPAEKPSAAPPPPSGMRAGGGAPPSAGQIDLYDPRMQMAGPPTREGAAVPGNPQADQYDGDWYAERQRQKRESVGRPWSIQR